MPFLKDLARKVFGAGKDLKKHLKVEPWHPKTLTSLVSKKKDDDDEKLKVDPEDDVWAVEESKVSEGRKYARSVVEAFYPVLFVASLVGLFPLVPYRQKDGTYVIKFKWTSYATILFVICFICVVGSTFWLLLSLICISTNTPNHPDATNKSADLSRSEEVFVYKRNALTLVILFTNYIHLTICMIAVYHRKDFIGLQFVYWTEVVELLQLDVGKNVAKKLMQNLLALLIFALAVIIMYLLNFSPGLKGSGSTFYIMFWRIIDPQSMWHPNIGILKHVFAAFILYVVLACYLYILWFYFNCRILRNILTIWNNRFQYCLHKQQLDFDGVSSFGFSSGEKPTSMRTSRAQLFQDHLVIFNLIEGVNTQFEVIMESFYLGTMVQIVFEAYAFVHTFFYAEFTMCQARQNDLFPILLFLCLQLFIYIQVTLVAAGVADEARHVLDIVRRKGMMTSRMDNELWFMLSMRLSFGGHEDVGIIGAGFFYVTKAFLLGAISAIVSHFIIFYQFEVPLGQTEEADANLAIIEKYRDVIFDHLEGVPNTFC